MPRRSPARYLAPLALVASLIALLVVVTPGGENPGGDVSPVAPAADTTTEAAPSPESEEPDPQAPNPQQLSGPRFYDVQPGDTPSTIAERTGVPLERLETLNPDIDPQQLTPGQRLRLRR